MKRKSVFVATGLALSILLSVPMGSSAALTPVSEPIESLAYSKVVSKLYYYPLNTVPPRTVRYSDAYGYQGTLSYVEHFNDGERIVARYSGRVTCSTGACVAR